MTNAESRIAYGVRELAEVTGLTSQHIHTMIRRGELKASKWGRRTLISAEEVNRILNKLSN